MKRGQGWLILAGVMLMLLWASDAVYAQNLLERLEQRVRDGLRVPGEVINPSDANSATPTPMPPNSGTVRPAENLPNPGSVAAPPMRPAERPSEAAVLGLELEEILVPGGGLTVTAVTPRSPADIAGFRGGDVLLMLDGRQVLKLQDVMDAMATHRPGDRINLRLRRDGQLLDTTALLAAAPKPAAVVAGATVTTEPSIPQGNARLGIEVDDLTAVENATPVQTGAIVISVQPNSPAEAVGIKKGDVIVALDGKLVTGVRTMLSAMSTFKPGQQIEVTYYVGNQLQRKLVPVVGPEGILPAATFAELKKKNENPGAGAASQESSGIGGFFWWLRQDAWRQQNRTAGRIRNWDRERG